MAAETDDDEEEAVLDELGGECEACLRNSIPLLLYHR